MRLVETGIRTLVLSTGMSPKSTGGWKPLGAAYSKFAVRCVRASSVGTSNFTVKVYGNMSTVNTTGAAVGAIGAYISPLITTVTQANVGQIKVSTATIVASYVKFSSTVFTTAAGRKLRIELLCIP